MKFIIKCKDTYYVGINEILDCTQWTTRITDAYIFDKAEYAKSYIISLHLHDCEIISVKSNCTKIYIV